MTTSTEKTRGQIIGEWIAARHAEGRTVYAQTPLRTIKLSPKHAAMIRVRGEHCEVQMGRRWDSINWTKITAA